MERQDWIELNLRGLADWLRDSGRSSGTGDVIEREGVVASISPATPGRSVFNGVVYGDPAALAAAYSEVAAAYEAAGCAWTVWVPEGQEAVAAMLTRAGHVLDSQPRAMGMSLDSVGEPDLSGIDWTADGDFEEACLVNDRAYGYPEGTWRAGIGCPDGAKIYTAAIDGEPAATVMTKDHDGAVGPDCVIWAVATLEAARGRGFATALMRQGLWEAVQRGCATSTLQSTKSGRRVYERVGYEDFGALQMWELRPPELAAEAHPGAPA